MSSYCGICSVGRRWRRCNAGYKWCCTARYVRKRVVLGSVRCCSAVHRLPHWLLADRLHESVNYTVYVFVLSLRVALSRLVIEFFPTPSVNKAHIFAPKIGICIWWLAWVDLMGNGGGQSGCSVASGTLAPALLAWLLISAAVKYLVSRLTESGIISIFSKSLFCLFSRHIFPTLVDIYGEMVCDLSHLVHTTSIIYSGLLWDVITI